MTSKIQDAKCPYCKHVFKTSAFGSGAWAQILWGQYAPDSTEHECEACGKKSNISLSQIAKYTAKKIKG